MRRKRKSKTPFLQREPRFSEGRMPGFFADRRFESGGKGLVTILEFHTEDGMTPLRIQFVLPFLGLTGGNKSVMEYANRLAKRGHDVWLIYDHADIPWWKPRGFLRTLLRDKGVIPWVDWFDVQVPIIRVPGLSGPRLPEADAVLATSYYWAEAVHRMPASAGRKYNLIQGYESDWIADKKFADDSYRLPLHHIVNASWLGRLMWEKFHAPSVKAITAVNYDQYQYRPDRVYNTPARCLMQYHTVPEKGIPDGIRAFEIAAQKVPGLSLTLFGTRTKDLVTPHATRCNVPESEMSDLYHDHDILIWPSLREGLGAPCIEAMACQCAVATTDNLGSEEFAFHEKTALVSPPGDVETLAAHIVRLATDIELRKRLGRDSCAWVREHITWDLACAGLEKCFVAPDSFWSGPNVSPY